VDRNARLRINANHGLLLGKVLSELGGKLCLSFGNRKGRGKMNRRWLSVLPVVKKSPILIAVSGLGILISVIALVTVAGDRHQPAKPLISKVKKTDTNSVTISIGGDAGVRTEDVFDVYQENRGIAALKITKVESEQSIAEITKIHPTKQLTTGDVVIRDVTLKFLEKLSLNSEIRTPAELGRQFAEADLGGGIKRVLYYGKPRSAGQPLIDQETGYPVTITGGCTEGKDYGLFVDAYNRSMKEHFQRQ